jgi:3-oxoacyl-[acyl-carrier protein] reductase
MELNLNQKNVLVTGSSRGIGFAIAQAFLDEGANVIVNSIGDFSMESLKVKNKSQLTYIKADVTQQDEAEKIVKKVTEIFNNRLDVLVCNVGSGKSIAPGFENRDEWQKSFEINFFSTTNIIEALKKFITRQTGSILCISSICGLEVLGAPLTYSAAKAALNSYVVGVSRVLGKDGVRVNAIAPGNILFEGSTWEAKIKENKLAVQDMLEREVSLKTLGNVDDISNMALFLSSEKAKFITGSIVVVDGGQVRSW